MESVTKGKKQVALLDQSKYLSLLITVGLEVEDEDNDIMSHLNYRKLQKIKEDFTKKEEGLEMDEFIKVMLNHLPETRDKVGLVKNLVELFR